MPRSAYSRSKKYGRRAVGFARGATTVAKLASDVYKMKKLMNVEVKRHDVSTNGNYVTAASGVTSAQLTAIDQGDTAIARDGNSVRATGLTLRVMTRIHASATSSLARAILVQSTFGEGVAPILSDVLQNSSSVLSYQNIDQSRGYKILMDRKLVLDNEHEFKLIDKHFKLSQHLKYDGATGSTDHTYGQIWLFLITDEATNVPSFAYESRLRFVDN